MTFASISMNIFSSSLVLEKPPVGKGKDKSAIQCVEWFCDVFYVGTKDGLIQYFTTKNSTGGETPVVKEVARRKMGRSVEIRQLKAVPVLNHLLALWDGSIATLNMFTLEPVSFMKRIQNISLFGIGEPAVHAEPVFVELFAASSRRRSVSVYKVCVDRWDCVGSVALSQDPVALAVDETCLCVATSDSYVLHDYRTQNSLELFKHNLGKQNVIAKHSVRGEFLLSGPGNLGMFVTSSGISRRAPVPWPDGVMDAAVNFPYVLVLQSKALHVYSMLDQRLKQIIPLHDAPRSLLSTTGPTTPKSDLRKRWNESVYVIAEKEIHRLSQNPLKDQIEALLGSERVNDALTLLDGVQELLPEDTFKTLHRRIICTSGWIHFYREDFPDANELFIKGDLDPRELISLYPSMAVVGQEFRSGLSNVNNAKDLSKLKQEDRPTFQKYLSFLGRYLRQTRGVCPRDVDTALFKVYLTLEEFDNLTELLSSPNECVLDVCVPDLEQHKRYFTIGRLYQSQGQHFKAIQTWVQIVNGELVDSEPRSDVLMHIVKALCHMTEESIIIKFIDWVLQKDQRVGVLIFTQRDLEEQSPFAPDEILSILTNYPAALILYLEFLVHVLHSTTEKHHTLLATLYISHILQAEEKRTENKNTAETQEKLQQFLWKSSLYDANAVYVQLQSSWLRVEKAIVLGRLGQHQKALQLLVHQEADVEAAETFCWRAAEGRDRAFAQQLFVWLLQVYLRSRRHATAAMDLLNRNTATFNPLGVLDVLPGSWSVQLVRGFLRESLRATVHERRMRGLERSLAMMENLRHRHAWMEMARVKVKVDGSTLCRSCRLHITGSEFLLRPTGEVVHTHCSGLITDTV